MKPIGVDESWLVMFYAFLVHTAADGLQACLGIIGTQLIERRNFNREDVAWIIVTFWSSSKFTSFIASTLSRKCGFRIPVILGGIVSCLGYAITGLLFQSVNLVVVFVGIISGLGHCLLYIPTWITANTYYDKKRQLANSLVMSGSAIGIVIFPPFVEWLLNDCGLQGTYLMLGGMALNTVVIGALIPPLIMSSEVEKLLNLRARTKSEESGKDVGRDPNVPNVFKKKVFHSLFALDLFKNWKYAVYVLSSCLIDPITIHTFYTYVPDFVIHIGYSEELSWQPITICGVTNMLARISMGVSNKSVGVLAVVFTASGLVVGLAFLLLAVPILADHFWILCLISTVYGFGKGLYWGLRGPVLAEIVDIEDFDRALGTEQFLTGFFVLLCPLQGKLFDLTGEYTGTFVMSGTMATVGGLLLCFVAGALMRTA